MSKIKPVITIANGQVHVPTFALPPVSQVIMCDPSEKGNRTIAYNTASDDVWVEDGGYTVSVAVTVYVKPGTIKGMGGETHEAALSDMQKAQLAKANKALAGLDPQILAAALAQLTGAGK